MWNSRKSHNLVCVQGERAALHKELVSLREQREALRAELEKYKECDPEVVEEMREYRTQNRFSARALRL